MLLLGQSIALVSAAGPPDSLETDEYKATDFLIVTYGTYLDIDLDGNEDDVLTEYTIFSPTGALTLSARLDFELYLALPSGKTFYFEYRAYTELDGELPFDIHWLNCAEEEGDYTFTCVAWLRGTDINGVRYSIRVTQDIVFDPPDQEMDGGIPTGLVYF